MPTITEKIWGDSGIWIHLILRCACGAEFEDDVIDIGISFPHHTASTLGWRFNDAGDRCICPKCGPKKIPEVYKNARVSDRPRIVRRVGVKARQQDQEEVRRPRRVRGT